MFMVVFWHSERIQIKLSAVAWDDPYNDKRENGLSWDFLEDIQLIIFKWSYIHYFLVDFLSEKRQLC